MYTLYTKVQKQAGLENTFQVIPDYASAWKEACTHFKTACYYGVYIGDEQGRVRAGITIDGAITCNV